jgi:5-methylthioadenosine/S-adenosylhomocysteine deaminase
VTTRPAQARPLKPVALVVALLAGTFLFSRVTPPSSPRLISDAYGERVLIRGASLALTMDSQVGEGPLGVMEDADVLLERGRIAAVGQALPGGRNTRVIDAHGKIVLPGFVDLHTHLWQSLIRGCGTDQELNGWLARCVRPLFDSPISGADAYAGVRLSALDEIATGVTTVVDWSHAFNADFARGNLRALGDSRLRFVFTYFARNDPSVFDEIRRVKREVIDPSPRAGLHVGSHPSLSNLAALAAASRLARELGAPLDVHLSESPADRAEGQMDALRQAGALRPGLLAAHAIHLTGAELDELAANDVRVAHNPLSNMRLASGVIRIDEMHRRDIKVGLGLDGGTNDTSDMFSDMRAAVGLQRATSFDPARYPTPADALVMATRGGAQALGMDREIGSLTPGKKADLQILNPNAVNFAPRVDWVSQLVFNGRPSNVEWVFVDGRVLKRTGRLSATGTDHVIRAAQRAADRVKEWLHGSGRQSLGGRQGVDRPDTHDSETNHPVHTVRFQGVIPRGRVPARGGA